MESLILQLQERFGERVKIDEPMAKHTNFRLGGPAKAYLEVKTEEELKEALSLAEAHSVRTVIHGGGSNVLYADGPIDALVLVPAFREMTIESLGGATTDEILNHRLSEFDGNGNKYLDPIGSKGQSPTNFGTASSPKLSETATPVGAVEGASDGDVTVGSKRVRVTAGAGVPSVMLARKTAEAGLAGLTWMISLPGTVGGAVRGNAGCFGGETKDFLVSARVLKGKSQKSKMSIESISKEDLQMRYRHSILKEEEGKGWVILSATFELPLGDLDALKQELETTLAKRKATQPQNAGCAGCAFKNYEIESDEELERLQEKLDIPEAMVQARRLSAGWIIDQLGLKGFAVGNAKVNETHGNFLVSEGATADEILQLIAVIKTRVRNELGIQLQEEIELVV